MSKTLLRRTLMKQILLTFLLTPYLYTFLPYNEWFISEEISIMNDSVLFYQTCIPNRLSSVVPYSVPKLRNPER
jgi:hypothetical protein